jgi:hypothetical protein
MPFRDELRKCICTAKELRDTKRQATQNGCLGILLGDGDKEIEIAYGEEKKFCTELTRAAKAEQKSLVPARQSPTKQRRKDPFHFVLKESPFTSVFADSRGHPSL